MSQKVFIILPDGIGLKNFAYTNFYNLGKENDIDFSFWNATPFDLKKLGYEQLQLPPIKLHKYTDVLKNTRKHIELDSFKRRFNDPVYDTYKFPFSRKTIKQRLKSTITKLFIQFNNSEKGLEKIRRKIKKNERKTTYYKLCREVLAKENPKVVFCTNQRSSLAIAPLLAAQDEGIPTATFIFSWDNLPKATMVVETDYYFVWSVYMKEELLKYYPYINESQVLITGTPQFENHHEVTFTASDKLAFFEQYGLDKTKQYICYSGDDITTCPDDQDYLQDLAVAVRQLNNQGANLGVVFRKCPVDVSSRYDAVIEKNNDIIVPIDPKWENISSTWNTIMPTKEDLLLQTQTVAFTEMVVNLGSSMVFDYVAQNKPCAFVNYESEHKRIKDWTIKKIYDYVHFKSMISKRCVVWLNNPEEIAKRIRGALEEKQINDTKEWFKVVNKHPINMASYNIVNSLKTIMK